MPSINQGKEIKAKIATLAKAEKITKAVLSELSRDVLEYIVINDSNDIATVNRLLSVLTPQNKQAATHYFKHFLFFQLDEEVGTFGSKMKHDKQIDKKRTLVEEWLQDEANDIWAWADANLEVKPLTPFQGRITSLVEQALKGKEAKREGQEDLAPLDPIEILQCVMAGGISLDDVTKAIASLPETPVGEAVAA